MSIAFLDRGCRQVCKALEKESIRTLPILAKVTGIMRIPFINNHFISLVPAFFLLLSCSTVMAAEDADPELLPTQQEVLEDQQSGSQNEAAAEQALSAEELAELEQTALERSLQLQRFEERIATLESAVGPYDASLIEALGDMARYCLEIGRPQAAVDLYERVLNVTRITDGLYGQSQLPVLEALTDAHRAAGNWQLTDDREYLAFHLKSRFFPAGSQAFADAVMTLANWKLQALQGNLLRGSSNAALRDLDELHDAYLSALTPLDPQAMGDHQPVDSATRLSLLYGKAQAEFSFGAYLANSVPSYLRFPVDRYVSEYVCRDVAGADGQVRRSCGTVRVENPRYYEYEREKSRYRDSIRRSLISLGDSVEALRLLVEQDPDLAGADQVPASVRLQEAESMAQELQRGYRRSAVW